MKLLKKEPKETKPKYESPVIIPLGEVAKGAGAPNNCANGAGAMTTCTVGSGT